MSNETENQNNATNEPTSKPNGAGLQNESEAFDDDLPEYANAKRTPRNGGRPKAVKNILKEVSAENVEILSVQGINTDSTGQEIVTLSDTSSGALALLAEKNKIESQLNSVYYLATNVTAINDRGQLLLYNPMAALKAIELLIDIKGLKDNQRASRGGVNVFAQNVRSIDLKPKS